MIAEHKGEIPFVVLIIPYLSGVGLGLNLLSEANVTWLAISILSLSLFLLRSI